MAQLKETPSQTAGPFVHIGLLPSLAGIGFAHEHGPVLAGPDTTGERIRIEGRVLDGLGAPCRDVVLEIWQANAAGQYDDPAFQGWGRAGTHLATGLYAFETIKPGAVMGRHGRLMAPHVSVWLVARGINVGLQTRMYFGDEAANTTDPVLNLIEHPARRETLIAPRTERDGQVVYEFNIRLQGDNETVFLDV